MRRLAAGLACLLIVGACSGDDSSSPTTTTAASTTTAPTFTGDKDSELCQLLRQVDLGTLAGTPKTGAVKDAFATLVRLFQQMEAVAPTELQEDVTTLTEGIVLLDHALDEVDFDFDRLPDDVVHAINDPAFTVAGDRVVTYRKQVCGL